MVKRQGIFKIPFNPYSNSITLEKKIIMPNNYLEHGLHNEGAAHHLYQTNQFNDWTVTTVF